jgi:hypothetical protein
MTQAIPGAVLLGRGTVQYDPKRADPARGFGPFEVHPQRVKLETIDSVRLEHNGDWIVLVPPELCLGDRALRYLAFTEKRGGREAAEMWAALQNAELPTRVVDLAGLESTSRHTAESVQARLDAHR